MQRIISIVLALCLGLGLAMDAHAKRFGGGRSFGMAPSHHARQVHPNVNRYQAAPHQQPAQGARAGAGRWLGPLAGIAAGGLLASLLMGSGFQGLQLLDILVIAVLAFVIWRFIRSRHPQAGPVPDSGLPRNAMQPNAYGFGSARPAPAIAAPINAPSWFEADNFITAARQYFLLLQQHWDANEMDQIAEYVTPEVLAYLKGEREQIGDAYQSTYIDNLDVSLDGVDDNADKTVATLTFTGVAKTSRFDQGEPFSESWRMERKQGKNQPWLLAGVRQNG